MMNKWMFVCLFDIGVDGWQHYDGTNDNYLVFDIYIFLILFLIIILFNYSGKRISLDGSSSVRLDNGGPINMVLTEIDPDTILINEVDKASGRIVMISSLSLVTDHTADSMVVQLIKVSHEVAAAPKTAPPASNDDSNNILEGHQVWRFHRKDAYQ